MLIYSTYFILMYDLWFILKWLTLPLIDNYLQDEYQYDLHVYTGFNFEASTESNIFFTLLGTGGNTGIRQLSDGIRKVCIKVS